MNASSVATRACVYTLHRHQQTRTHKLTDEQCTGGGTLHMPLLLLLLLSSY